LSGATAVPDAGSVLAASATDTLGGAAPLPDGTSGLLAPATDALSGAAAMPDTASLPTAPATGALDGAAPVPGGSSGLLAPVTDALGGAAPFADTTARLTAPATDALSGAAALPGAATPPAGDGSPLGFDDVFPIDPATIAQVLASPETRLVIVGLFGAYAAGRASGVGMLDFAQPLLRSCTASVRLAFSPVRLIPCERGASSGSKALMSRAAATAATVEPRHHGARADDSRTWFRPPVVAAGTSPSPLWSVPRNDNVVLRIVAVVLAALSAAIAGVGGRRLVRGRAAATHRYPRNP
jgi:hypothetical protein